MKTAVLVAGLMLGALGWNGVSRHPVESESGQEVYISEGCIHCHSQFVRPETLDTEIYGPATRPDSSPGEAVLIGNRRQGPDLSGVGLRRSREWNREHLKDPQAVSPGTRMPSYQHLFEGEGQRGEALLDYLQGLGGEGAEAWFRQVSTWRGVETPGNAEDGKTLFARLCQQCHGTLGDGDGVLADRFSPPPTNFANGGFRFVPLTLPLEARRSRLAGIVKYGVSGTAMPGHEYLTDGQIADLVSYLIRLPEPRGLGE